MSSDPHPTDQDPLLERRRFEDLDAQLRNLGIEHVGFRGLHRLSPRAVVSGDLRLGDSPGDHEVGVARRSTPAVTSTHSGGLPFPDPRRGQGAATKGLTAGFWPASLPRSSPVPVGAISHSKITDQTHQDHEVAGRVDSSYSGLISSPLYGLGSKVQSLGLLIPLGYKLWLAAEAGIVSALSQKRHSQYPLAVGAGIRKKSDDGKSCSVQVKAVQANGSSSTLIDMAVIGGSQKRRLSGDLLRDMAVIAGSQNSSHIGSTTNWMAEASNCNFTSASTSAYSSASSTFAATDQASNNSNEGRPFSRGRMGSLPDDAFIRAGLSLFSSDVVLGIHEVCKAKAEKFAADGPWFIRSDDPPAPSRITFMRISTTNAGGAKLERTEVIWPPPYGVICWGAAGGLMALREDTGRCYLHCIICGYQKELTPFPVGLTPMGVFFRELEMPYVILSSVINATLFTSVYVRQYVDDEEGFYIDGLLDHGASLTWSRYPGTDQLDSVRTINFPKGMSCMLLDGGETIAVDELSRMLNQKLKSIAYSYPSGNVELWERNGEHIVLCDSKSYICALFRGSSGMSIYCYELLKTDKSDAESDEENDEEFDEVSDVDEEVCEDLDDDSGYTLSRVSTIGPYSAFLGFNQPLVFPSEENNPARLANTVYIENPQGTSVMAINIETQVVSTIEFPTDSDLCHFHVSGWLACPPPSARARHCRA